MATDDAALAKERRESAQAIHERDEAVAEWDFILKFLQDIAAAFDKSCGLAFEATAAGVEIRALYPSQADAQAVATHIRTVRAMGSLAAA